MADFIGLIINPIAGMGGKVALKGTDGPGILAEAMRRGAAPEANQRAVRTLKRIKSLMPNITVLTCSRAMGQEACTEAGISYKVVYSVGSETSAEDTKSAALKLKDCGVSLILFAGGDGTARNLYDAVGTKVPALGIPAGVKIQSGVFAVDPDMAGLTAVDFLRGRSLHLVEKEVIDLDENAYRNGHIHSSLYGYLKVPDQPKYVQSAKISGESSSWTVDWRAAKHIIDHMEQDVCYAIGAGTTAKTISQALGVSYELLGVDVVSNKRLIAQDVTESQLWEYVCSGNLQIVVSPIGGQGFLFGRGNHQFSPRILSRVGRENIFIIASMKKIMSIKDHCLRVDCGDPQVDQQLRGYYKVICGDGRYVAVSCI